MAWLCKLSRCFVLAVCWAGLYEGCDHSAQTQLKVIILNFQAFSAYKLCNLSIRPSILAVLSPLLCTDVGFDSTQGSDGRYAADHLHYPRLNWLLQGYD